VAIAHNGNLVNAKELRNALEQRGSIFQSTMDSEVIVHLLACSQKQGIEDQLIDALGQVSGAYSLIFLFKDKLIGVRDPRGFRPLCLGALNGSYVLASETCALDIIQAHYIRDIEPGEIIIIDESGIRSLNPFPPRSTRSASLSLFTLRGPTALSSAREFMQHARSWEGSLPMRVLFTLISSFPCLTRETAQRLVLQKCRAFPLRWASSAITM